MAQTNAMNVSKMKLFAKSIFAKSSILETFQKLFWGIAKRGEKL